MSRLALRVYGILACFRNANTGKAYPSVGTVAKICDRPRRRVQDALRELESKGYLNTEKFIRRAGGYGPNSYYFPLLDDAPKKSASGRESGSDAPKKSASDASKIDATPAPKKSAPLRRKSTPEQSRQQTSSNTPGERDVSDVPLRSLALRAAKAPDGPEIWEQRRQAARKAREALERSKG